MDVRSSRIDFAIAVALLALAVAGITMIVLLP